MKTSRRGFLLAGLSSTSVLTLGCGGRDQAGSPPAVGGSPGGAWGGSAAIGGTGAGGRPGPSGGAGGAGGIAIDPNRPVDGGSDAGLPTDGGRAGVVCRATRPDIEGPFFTPDSPERSVLLEAGIDGPEILVRGRILDGACRPIAGAVLDVWQADASGAYDNVGYRLRGHQVTDADGRYTLLTIVPGRYLNGSQYRPAHIHAKVYVPGRPVLTTQLYFEGDPFNEVDPWFSEMTMLRPRPDEGNAIADFDFVVT